MAKSISSKKNCHSIRWEISINFFYRFPYVTSELWRWDSRNDDDDDDYDDGWVEMTESKQLSLMYTKLSENIQCHMTELRKEIQIIRFSISPMLIYWILYLHQYSSSLLVSTHETCPIFICITSNFSSHFLSDIFHFNFHPFYVDSIHHHITSLLKMLQTKFIHTFLSLNVISLLCRRPFFQNKCLHLIFYGRRKIKKSMKIEMRQQKRI